MQESKKYFTSSDGSGLSKILYVISVGELTLYIFLENYCWSTVPCEIFSRSCYMKLPCSFTSLSVCPEHSLCLQKLHCSLIQNELQLTICSTRITKEYVLFFSCACILSWLSLKSAYLLLIHPFSSLQYHQGFNREQLYSWRTRNRLLEEIFTSGMIKAFGLYECVCGRSNFYGGGFTKTKTLQYLTPFPL